MTVQTSYWTNVEVQANGTRLHGLLTVPPSAEALVVFAHGSGSSRRSPRNRFVSDCLNDAGLGTLLFDLLRPEEDETNACAGSNRFNIKLLTERLSQAVNWVCERTETRNLRIGLFGASTGAAAALETAADMAEQIGAVVSRGGRPDLAAEALPKVQAPTLLIVGGDDSPVIELNREAAEHLTGAEHKLEILPGASHLFEEPGQLDEVARLSIDWFVQKLGRGTTCR